MLHSLNQSVPLECQACRLQLAYDHDWKNNLQACHLVLVVCKRRLGSLRPLAAALQLQLLSLGRKGSPQQTGSRERLLSKARRYHHDCDTLVELREHMWGKSCNATPMAVEQCFTCNPWETCSMCLACLHLTCKTRSSCSPCTAIPAAT